MGVAFRPWLSWLPIAALPGQIFPKAVSFPPHNYIAVCLGLASETASVMASQPGFLLLGCVGSF